MTAVFRHIRSVHQVLLGIEHKLITDPLEARTIHRHGLLRILRTYLFVREHLISRLLLPLVFVGLVIRRLEIAKRRNDNRAGIDKRHLIHTVGTPLAVSHRLLPAHTYYRIERESRVLEIVVLIRIVVCQVLTPNLMIRTSLVHQLRSYSAENEIQPMEVLVPVEVRDLILVHVERTNGQRTRLVVTRSGQELVLLAYRERTTLNRQHTYRVDVTHTFIGLEIRSFPIKIIPTGGVTNTRIQLTLVTRNSSHCHRNDQEILKYVFHMNC